MKQVVISPSFLSGTVAPPPSKSAAHRAIICASLAQGASTVAPYEPSADIDATIRAMHELGAEITAADGTLHIEGMHVLPTGAHEIDCRESGSTLRFLIPVAAALGSRTTFTGTGRLPQRPIGPYLECLPHAGVTMETAGGLPLTVSGRLAGGDFELPGDVSSQFITGLLLAFPLVASGSRIRLTSPLQSAGYIDLTRDIQKRFGIEIRTTPYGYTVPEGQSYRPCSFAVESDWSQAAFWLCAGALSNSISCTGLDPASKQSDRAIVELLRRFGARITHSGRFVTAHSAPLHGIVIDASQIPDLVPILAATACFARGRTAIVNAARLRIKESDRLRSMALGLRAFGAKIEELDDGLLIDGGKPLPGGNADGANDHRIVMALSVAAARCTGPCTITGSESVAKSYPAFFEDYQKLGGIADVINVR